MSFVRPFALWHSNALPAATVLAIPQPATLNTSTTPSDTPTTNTSGNDSGSDTLEAGGDAGRGNTAVVIVRISYFAHVFSLMEFQVTGVFSHRNIVKMMRMAFKRASFWGASRSLQANIAPLYIIVWCFVWDSEVIYMRWGQASSGRWAQGAAAEICLAAGGGGGLPRPCMRHRSVGAGRASA